MATHPDPCLSFDEALSAWLDGESPSWPGGPAAPDDTALVAHLAACTRCRGRVEAFRAVDARLRRLPARPVPAGLEADLLARIAAERRTDASPAGRVAARAPGRRRSRFGLALGAAMASAAALALWLDLGAEPPSRTPSREAVVAELEAASDDELAAALELETLQDLDVIANLDLLERSGEGENGRG